MKKKFLVLFLLSFVLILPACANSQKTNQASEVKVEKNTIDISDKNGQEVQAAVGDVLYLKLIGLDKKNYQWSVASPEVSEFLTLTEHKVSVLDETETAFTDEWQLEITKAGTFDLKFEYGQVNKDPESSFSVKVVSQ